MWHPLLMFQRADPALADSARELLRATARSLIVTTLGVCGTLLLVVWIKPPSDVDTRTIPLMVAAILACLAALAMLPHRLMAAAAVWQAALGALLLLAVHLFREPLIGSLLALFPLIAAVTLSWPGALIAEGAIIALALGLTQPVLAPPLPAPYAVGVAAAGAPGAAASHHVSVGEVLEGTDDAHHQVEEEHWREHGQCHLPELVPPGGSVNGSRLV